MSWIGVAAIVPAGLLASAVLARSDASAASGPRVGGTVTQWIGNPPACLDPAREFLLAESLVNEKVMDPLLTVDPKGKLQGDLALRWKIAAGGKQITFTLRHGVKFSNGDPFTAQDVKYTIDRVLNPATQAQLASSLVNFISRVEVLGPYTVRIDLKVPSRTVLVSLTDPGFGILDPAAKTTCNGGVGTGAWKIQSISPGYGTITLVRNRLRNWEPTWFHNRGPAYISKLVLKSITANATAISELVAHQIDVASVPGDQISRVRGNRSFVLKQFTTQGLYWMGFNLAHPPFNNLTVRKAFAAVIDKNAIIKAAFNGQAKPAYSPIPATVLFSDKNAKASAPVYNPTAAQAVLSANHVTGPFDLIIYNRPEFLTMAELIQSELASVGVKVNIIAKDPATYFALAQKGNFDIYLLDYYASDPDLLYSLLHSSQTGSNGYNIGDVKDPALDAALVAGRETLNRKKAAADYAQVQKIVLTRAYMVPILSTVQLEAFRNNIKGIHLGFGGTIPWADLYVSG